MNEDRIWILVARKLAEEATVEEVQELTELLRQNPELSYSIEVFSDWWNVAGVKQRNAHGVEFNQILFRILKTSDGFTIVAKRRKE